MARAMKFHAVVSGQTLVLTADPVIPEYGSPVLWAV